MDMDVDMDPESLESIKRRRVDNAQSIVQENATRAEIEERMAQFIASKREQINESNRQEFIKRTSSSGTGAGSSESQDVDDDGCARADARKLNRTIQMKLETVKNEALTKTNPRTHTLANDSNIVNSGLDERLRNIQVHLNLRIGRFLEKKSTSTLCNTRCTLLTLLSSPSFKAAIPSCTIAERIRIVEDVIIQLERDYPLWSALHFNQPNRVVSTGCSLLIQCG
jgi:hypothetical protein